MPTAKLPLDFIKALDNHVIGEGLVDSTKKYGRHAMRDDWVYFPTAPLERLSPMSIFYLDLSQCIKTLMVFVDHERLPGFVFESIRPAYILPAFRPRPRESDIACVSNRGNLSICPYATILQDDRWNAHEPIIE